MGTHYSASSLLRAQVERFRRFEGTQEQLHREMVEAGHQDHIDLTSGTISTAQFIAMGHPLGRNAAGRMRGKRGGGRVPLLPINRQSGTLQGSLFVNGPSGPDEVYRIGFSAPYAKFVLALEGTSKMKMVPRGFFQELRKRNAARLHGQLLKARDEQQRS